MSLTYLRPNLVLSTLIQDVVNAEAKGRGGSKVISNPFAGIAPIPVDVPSDPLSGLMAMEVEDLGSHSNGRLGVEQICGKFTVKIQFGVSSVV